MGIFETLGMGNTPAGQFVSNNRNMLTGMAATMNPYAPNLAQALQPGFGGAMQGRQADNAWQKEQQAQLERAAAIQQETEARNRTIEMLSQTHPELAQAVQAGGVDPLSAWQRTWDLQDQEAGVGGSRNAGLTPVFLENDQGQQLMAQPLSSGGFLINGEVMPGAPEGFRPTNRPVAQRPINLGTSWGSFNGNNGTIGEDTIPIDVRGAEFEKAIGGNIADTFTDLQGAAQDASASLRATLEAKQLLDSGVITGFGADWMLNAGKALQAAGVNLNADAIANTEAFAATRAQEVGRIIKLFGAGTGLSDADREFATKAAAGQITMNEASIRRILDINERASRNIIERYNQQAEQVEGGQMPNLALGAQSPSSNTTSTGIPWSIE